MKVEHFYSATINLTPTSGGSFTSYAIILPSYVQADHLNLQLSTITPFEPTPVYTGWSSFYFLPNLSTTVGYVPAVGPAPGLHDSFISINWGLDGTVPIVVNVAAWFTDPANPISLPVHSLGSPGILNS